jgi:argininosuccinate synthase
MSDIKKVVLAYSGGLDTSVILKWLQDTYQCEVVTFTADLGQGEELEPARAKAIKLGIKPENIYIDDLREEFVRDFVFPMFRANTIYEGEYLLGTSIARPLIAKRLVEIATPDRRRHHFARRHRQGQRPGALRAGRLCADAECEGHRAVARVGSAVARKAAGLRRDARHPDRHEAQAGWLALFDGRQPAAHQLRRPPSGRSESARPKKSMWRWTVSPEKAPDQAEYIDLEFEGRLVAINGTHEWRRTSCWPN